MRNYLNLPSCKSIMKSLTSSADCGCCNIYNNTYDSMNIKKTVALESHPEAGDLKSVSVLKDPFIMQVAEKKIASIYTTDTALSYIMAVTHSQLSWYEI